MILPEYKESDVRVLSSTLEGLAAGLDSSKVSKGMHVLINLYTNPFIFCQELASNAIDAHIEAKVDKPIQINLENTNGQPSITFSDWGPGMNPDRVVQCYTFLSSTKEDDNSQIGGFGLGSKSVFVYTDSLLIETVCDKKKYFYLVTRTNSAIDIKVLKEEIVDLPNQTHITIDIKPKDVEKVKDTIEEKLAYFKNVVFTGLLSKFNSTFIYECDEFYINPERTSPHVVIGGVNYPIQSSPNIKVPANCMGIGIKFNIGELVPLPTRENLQYNDSTIQKINKKWEEILPRLHFFLYKEFPVTFKNASDFLLNGRDTNEVTIKPGVTIKFGSFGHRKFSHNWIERDRLWSIINQYVHVKTPTSKKTQRFDTVLPDDHFIIMDENGTGKKFAYLESIMPDVRFLYVRTFRGTKYTKAEIVSILSTAFPTKLSDVVVPSSFKYKVKKKDLNKENIHCSGSYSGDYKVQDLVRLKGKFNMYVGLKRDRGSYESKLTYEAKTRLFKKIIYVSEANYKILMQVSGFLSLEEELKKKSVVNRMRRIATSTSIIELNYKTKRYKVVIYDNTDKKYSMLSIRGKYGSVKSTLEDYKHKSKILKILIHDFIHEWYATDYGSWESGLVSKLSGREDGGDI